MYSSSGSPLSRFWTEDEAVGEVGLVADENQADVELAVGGEAAGVVEGAAVEQVFFHELGVARVGEPHVAVFGVVLPSGSLAKSAVSLSFLPSMGAPLYCGGRRFRFVPARGFCPRIRRSGG